MKVLILTEEQYPLNLGGGTTYLKMLSKGLEYHRVHYKIIAPKFYNKSTAVKDNKVLNQGIFLRKYDSFFLRSFFKLYYYPIWCISTLFHILGKKKNQDFDIIQVNEILFSGFLGLFLARILGKKIVLTMHGLYSEALKDRATMPSFIINLIFILEKFIVSRMDQVYCVSQDIAKYYSKFNSKSIFVPNFIDLSVYKKRNFSSLKTIGYIGRLSKEKNIDILVNSAALNKNKSFLIIGDGPEKEYLENLSRSLKLKNIIFLGRRYDIPKLHQKIDLVVYIWPNESFGLSALEAMASGIPVIAADTNQMHFFVGEAKSGIVIPKDKISSQTVSKAIRTMENKRLYKRYSDNAFKTARDYDYRVVVKSMLNEMQKLV